MFALWQSPRIRFGEMEMNAHLVIHPQYLAALGMLRQAIVQCPESLWDAPGKQDKFWRKSYHALFFAVLQHRTHPAAHRRTL